MTAIESTAASVLSACKYERIANATPVPTINTSNTTTTVANLWRLISLTINSALEARVDGELGGAAVETALRSWTIVFSELHTVLASRLVDDDASVTLSCNSRRTSFNSIATSLMF